MMKLRVLSALILSSCLCMAATVQAQPSWGKKAVKSVFTLKTFAPDGSLLGSAGGVFVGPQGEAVSCYAPFRGAASAVVIDAAGKELAVECMLGANETYDVAKFRVSARQTTPLPMATATLPSGAGAWLLPYRDFKGARQAAVRKVETFSGQYGYYTLAFAGGTAALTDVAGLPLLNDEGQLVGLMQPVLTVADTLRYAVSARYADSLRISGLSINDPALRAVHIKKDLPTTAEQALVTLYVAGSTLDSTAYAGLIDDFISRFPDVHDGYEYRAQLALAGGNCEAAQRDMERAVSVGSHTDEAHYSYSRMIYQKLTMQPEPPYAPWTLDKALEEAEAAYRISAQPVYRHQQALVLFAMKRYAEAAAVYDELSRTPLRSAEHFYEASRCQEMLRDTVAQLALLDSAVSMFSRPLLKEAAPYLLARAQVRLKAERFRDAVADLNDYESLMKTQLTHGFYYLRHQADLGGKLYQQALNDINQAIALRPDNDLYLAEKASLLVRVGLYDEAAETARQLLQLAPDQSDGHLFLGLALCLSGQKEEGLRHLQQARDLGDPQAEGFIARFQ